MNDATLRFEITYTLNGVVYEAALVYDYESNRGFYTYGEVVSWGLEQVKDLNITAVLRKELELSMKECRFCLPIFSNIEKGL